MNKKMIERLQAVLAERSQRETAHFSFFQQIINEGGSLEGVFVMETGDTLTVDDFVKRVCQKKDTTFVLLEQREHDEERDAYWEEIELSGPTLEEMREENEWTGTSAEFWEMHERRQEKRRAAPGYEERRLKAERYQARLDEWSEFFDEMAARAESNRLKHTRTPLPTAG